MDAGEFYGRLSAEYDRRFSDPFSLMENEVVFERLLKSDFRSGTVLDIGCGTGLALDHFREFPEVKYVGVDIAPAMIARARRKWAMMNGRVSFHVAPMEEMPFISPGSIDCVVSLFASFSYSKNPDRTREEIWRVLRPGGRIWIMAYSEARTLIRGPVSDGYVNWAGYTPASLWSLFSGFWDVEVSGLFLLTRRLPRAVCNAFPSLMARVESSGLERALPALCRYLLITGRKSL